MKIRSILHAIFIVTTLVLVSVFARIEFSKQELEDASIVHLELNTSETLTLNWPEERAFKIDLESIHNDSYIYLELSKQDTYVLEFVNTYKDHTHRLVIDTRDWAWFNLADDSKPISQLIPSYIVEDGFNTIYIRAVSGDASFDVKNVQLSSEKLSLDHYVNSIDFEVKQLEIFIDEEDLDKIEQKRIEAIQLGILLAEDGDEVEATFISEGEKSEGTLRLKGDWTDHLVGDKWSFRIDLKSDYAIYGMSEFSIQDPNTRFGLREAVLYDFYRSVGGVALRYDFVDVFVNGIYKGVYAYEEFFTSDMVEASSKRDGPIIKANEDGLWTSRAYDISNWVFDGNIETFKYSAAINDDYRLDLSEYAINLYQNYKEGSISMEDAFDIDLLAKYHAIEDIFVAMHGSRIWHNTRYYLNPITLKLEPVPFDELSNEYGNVYSEIGFSDFDWSPTYYNLYLSYLEEYSEKIPTYLVEHQDDIDEMLLMQQRDSSVKWYWDLSFIDERIAFIQKYISEHTGGIQ